MVRDSGISATRPVFPSFLLPASFKFPFPRRHSASTTSSASEPSPTSSPATTPSGSPPSHDPPPKAAPPPRTIITRRLSRAAPDILRCSTCGMDLAFADQIVSKGFTGRFGRAFLVAPPPPPPRTAGAPQEEEPSDDLLNVRLNRSESRQLVTGWHVVADISCVMCSARLGWKYVDAREPSQRYKVGKFILETERVVTFRHWEDKDVAGDAVDDNDYCGDREEGPERESVDTGRGGEEVEFDSEDEDECEDVFAGTWDASAVARRRSRMVVNRLKDTE